MELSTTNCGKTSSAQIEWLSDRMSKASALACRVTSREHRFCNLRPTRYAIMNGTFWLVVYAVSILLVSMVGGCLPVFPPTRHARLAPYLCFSSGVMLGAAFFHIMPDAIEISGEMFACWMSFGLVGLFCVELFFTPRSRQAIGSSQID